MPKEVLRWMAPVPVSDLRVGDVVLRDDEFQRVSNVSPSDIASARVSIVYTRVFVNHMGKTETQAVVEHYPDADAKVLAEVGELLGTARVRETDYTGGVKVRR